jgi:hypothetical protein
VVHQYPDHLVGEGFLLVEPGNTLKVWGKVHYLIEVDEVGQLDRLLPYWIKIKPVWLDEQDLRRVPDDLLLQHFRRLRPAHAAYVGLRIDRAKVRG